MNSRASPIGKPAARRPRGGKKPAAATVPDSRDWEYAEAVDLVRGMRDTVVNLRDGQIRHLLQPRGKISADFFCTAEHPTKGWYGLLADATGHGLPAAIFGLNTPMLFHQAVQRGLSLPEIFDRIHGLLMRQRLGGYFVCGLLVRVRGREIEVLNAGMPEALLLAPDGRLLQAFPSCYPPFGIPVDIAAAEQSFRLARGDDAALLLHTDGLSEMGVLSGTPLGTAGILSVAASAGASGVFDELVERISSQQRRPHDDISMVLIKLPLDGGPARTEEPAAPPASAEIAAELPNVETAARSIVEHFEHGLMLTDARQCIVYVNPAFSRITGYSLAEAVGQTPRLLNAGRHDAAFYREMWRELHERGAWNGEIRNRRKDGSLYTELLNIRALKDSEGATTHYLGTFFAIGVHQQREGGVRKESMHDKLTGLADRVLLHELGEQAMRRVDRSERSLGVLFIDLDRFKSINDSLGHDIGDAVLVEVVRRFAGTLREHDILSRFGGDEFVCLLPEVVSRQDAALVCGKLLGSLAEPVVVAGHCFKISASIGVSAYPSDAANLDDLIVLADRATLRAKQAGGNTHCFFSAEMAIAADHQLEMEARLDAALRNGELELHYQPKLDLHSQKVVGAEALVRWRDPQRGLVPPGEFIPVAEKSDLIASIGNWVLMEACAALSRMETILPKHFHVAVNVSPIQLARCDLAGEVGNALAASGVAPARLQLEVTESLFIRDAERAAAELERVASLGVSLALDDFGTGYSNLGSLAKLPLNCFKLDQGFVRNVDSNIENSTIARAAYQLAVGLGKDIVAEGIETCRECKKLKELGYRLGQGYIIARPMPEAKFVDFLKNWKPCRCPA